MNGCRDVGIIARNYAEVSASDRPNIGGKAWSVARLAQAGVPVPTGFCITGDLVSNALARNQSLANDLRNYFRAVDNGTLPDERLREALRTVMSGLGIDPRTASELRRCARATIPPTTTRSLIVRSSANIEDSSRASFAGQFKSKIIDNSGTAIWPGVRECWQAVLSPSLAAYAVAVGVRLSEVNMGFLVQRFVEFEYSGVLFTAAPSGRAGSGFFVEFVRGSPEKLVSGKATPDQCVLSAGADPVTWIRRSPWTRPPDAESFSRLAALASRCRAVLGGDQDIEWGIAEGDVLILQSRPITSGGMVGTG